MHQLPMLEQIFYPLQMGGEKRVLREGTAVRAVGKDGAEVTFPFPEGNTLLLHSLLSCMGSAHRDEDTGQNAAAFSSPSQTVPPWCHGCQHIPKPQCHVSQCANIPQGSPCTLAGHSPLYRWGN